MLVALTQRRCTLKVAKGVGMYSLEQQQPLATDGQAQALLADTLLQSQMPYCISDMLFLQEERIRTEHNRGLTGHHSPIRG